MKKSNKNNDFHNYIVFAVWFLAIFTLTYTVLYVSGFVPNEIEEDSKQTFLDDLREVALNNVSNYNNEVSDTNYSIEDPQRIVIPGTSIDIIVQNPLTKDPVLLDEYLKKGVVRYPDSGHLGKGNMLLFGHSSNWEVVKNKAYRSLNGIEKLKQGDSVYIDSDNYRYVYKVDNVKLAKADEVLVDFSRKANMVTLSTCNTFGAKQDRYVAEALFDHKEVLVK